MTEGAPSLTAQRVAAYRLGFGRVATSYGDPAGDEQLARDVAAGVSFEADEEMGRYLRGRTAFFDRVVVAALERDVLQIVAVGAGYDARSLRYAKQGVRWFEVDRAEVQQDKQTRLERLGLDAPGVVFLSRDLRHQGLAAALMGVGFDPNASSVMLCEGVALYLTRSDLESLLAELRALATVGTRVAMSLSASRDPARREAFESAVGALGEPALSSVTAQGAEELLAASRWRPADIPERATRAGFVVGTPMWVPPTDRHHPATTSRIGCYVEQVFHRAGTESLARHLSSTYSTEVTRTPRLDVGVFRVERSDGPPWIARVFPAARALEVTLQDAELLRRLVEGGFPAERCAHAEPVSTHDGQTVLVTEFAPGKAPPPTGRSLRLVGEMLGRLHSLPGGEVITARPGGAWHHLVLDGGGPRDELAAAVALLADAAPRVSQAKRGLYESLQNALAAGEDCDGLPCAVIHPDFVPVNIVSSPAGDVVVDWAGSGWGPRLWSLAWLLWAAGARTGSGVKAAVNGYRQHVALEEPELERLERAVATRPVVLACWEFATGRRPLAEAADRVLAVPPSAATIAAAARAAFKEPVVGRKS